MKHDTLSHTVSKRPMRGCPTEPGWQRNHCGLVTDDARDPHKAILPAVAEWWADCVTLPFRGLAISDL